jgi:hypothetical protein
MKHDLSPVDALIEKLDSPFGGAILKLLKDPSACFAVFTDQNLFGFNKPASEEDAMDKLKLELLFSVTTTVMMDIEDHLKFGIDKVMQVLAFEAGRRYEREQLHLNELESLFKE